MNFIEIYLCANKYIIRKYYIVSNMACMHADENAQIVY